MKKYTWEIKEETVNEETEEETEEAMEVVHQVSLRCSMLSGKAVITIDGAEFNIGTRPLALRGTNQVFRLGEMAAIIDFPKKGEPAVIIDGVRLEGKLV